MGKVDAPYLTSRAGAQGQPLRWFFQPPSRDRDKGWTTVRLHDEFKRPITSELAAAVACEKLADIYRRWRAGEEGYGPHRIDKLGRVAAPARKIRRGRNFRPGQVGAMVADYMASAMFRDELGEKTQAEYRIYLGVLVDRFGDDQWEQITRGAAREWLVARGRAGGESGMHACYRTCRAFFNRVSLVYTEAGHPGIVPHGANPFLKLNLSLPTATLIVWPRPRSTPSWRWPTSAATPRSATPWS